MSKCEIFNRINIIKDVVKENNASLGRLQQEKTVSPHKLTFWGANSFITKDLRNDIKEARDRRMEMRITNLEKRLNVSEKR